LLGWIAPSGDTLILTGLANCEAVAAQGGVTGYHWASQQSDALIPGWDSSIGPLALADIDGNGHFALFVGGRVVPGRWPEPANSRFYRYQSDTFTLDPDMTKKLEGIGLVSGAVFSDLDGDGLPELLLACEWGPIRVFRNQAGQFHEVTAQIQLAPFTGWWSGVTTGDFDGDGRPDIIASNWGLNTLYRATPEHPVAVYYGDLARRGLMDVVEAEFEPEIHSLAPRRPKDALAGSLPFVLERFATHKAYSEASLDAVLGEAKSRAHAVEANTLATTLFLNRGDHFEALPLPPEAQFAPAFALVVADFDGDGNEDVFLSQNSFVTEPSVPRADAGRGLLLLGDGKGRFHPIRGQESGIRIYGQQRGAAAADFNEDARTDLVVTQNAAETKLYINQNAKPGLRVRLKGSPNNPSAIGASVRLRFADRLGPARELRTGSGYLSQDSPVLVLGTPQPPIGVVIRWPGGRTTETPLPASSKSVTIASDGKIIP
jgi:hypothetical protein